MANRCGAPFQTELVLNAAPFSSVSYQNLIPVPACWDGAFFTDATGLGFEQGRIGVRPNPPSVETDVYDRQPPLSKRPHLLCYPIDPDGPTAGRGHTEGGVPDGIVRKR